MNRLILAAIVLVLGGLALRLLVQGMASDETKIRWMLEEMVEGFDEGQAGQSISGLARDWTHEGRPIDRDTIRGYVFGQTMQKGKGLPFPWDAEVPEETLVIEVAPEGGSATLTAEVRFSELTGATSEEDGTWNERWHLRLEADVQETEDGWRIVSSRHEDIQGVMIGN